MAKQDNGLGERPQKYRTKAGEVRYRARYSMWSIDANGTRRRVQRLVTGRSAAEVRDRLSAARNATNQGLRPPNDRLTVREFVASWRADVLPHEGLAPSTVRWYGEMLDHYVLPSVGDRTLTGTRALTIGDVEAMTAPRRAGTRSCCSVSAPAFAPAKC